MAVVPFPSRLPLLACLVLVACASMVPTTAARLSTLDPLTADPGQITAQRRQDPPTTGTCRSPIANYR